MASFIRVLRDLVLLLARLTLAAVALRHGWQRWQSEGIDAQVQAMAAQGVPAPEVFGWGITMLELVGGALLVFGVLTPLLGLLFAVQALLTLVWIEDPSGWWSGVGGIEGVALMGALALVVMVFGAGRASIDQLFRRPADETEDDLRYDEAKAV